MTHEFLQKYIGIERAKWYWRAKFDHIHYFHLGNIIQFIYNGQEFYGIILDSGNNGQNAFPQISPYNRDPGVNTINAYFGTNTRSNEINQKIVQLESSNNKVKVSIDGTFLSDADILEEESKNFFQDLITKFLCWAGDGIQKILIKSFYAKNVSKLTYKTEQIEGDTALNEEIQVLPTGAEYTGNLEEVHIPSTVINRNGEREKIFDKDVKIPIIPIDLYSLSINKIEMLDINFFDTTRENSNSFRNLIKDVTLTASKAVLYIATAFLITVLIWKSISIVSSSLAGRPYKRAEDKKIINSWIKGIVLIAVIYIVTALMIYFYEFVLDIITEKNNSNYIIRANVENVYSFNTNIIGFVKYMTLRTENISKMGYAIAYLIMALVNLIWALLMIARMIFMGILIIIAPLTAVAMASSKSVDEDLGWKSIFSFRKWFAIFMTWLWMPMIVILIQRLIAIII